MDLNTRIIEAVRQQPCLYANNCSLDERTRAWKKLAEKLKMQEQYLKIRWHSLQQRYQNDTNFKYAHKMDFLQRNMGTQVQTGEWPEFVITEEDLQDQQQDVGDEYVFVELDEEETKTRQEKEYEYKNELVQKAKQEIETKNLKNLIKSSQQQQHQRPAAALDKNKNTSKLVVQTVGTLNKNSSLPLESSEKVKPPKEPTDNGVQIVSKEKPNAIEKQNLEKHLETIEIKEEPNEDEIEEIPTEKEKPIKKDEPKKEELPPPPVVNRCEDDIFGELVSAMLKRMDDTKKKNVKKEIMNLLLT